MLPHAEAFADPSADARDPHEALLALPDRAERRCYLVTLAAAPLAGIGLAGVRNRVALLGGTLTLNAQPGRGTIVGIELAV